jgi:hypothetical protein
VATFAPHVERAVLEINDRFPALGKGSTYPHHGEDEPGGLPEQYYSADFWSTNKDVHDQVLRWVIEHHKRLGVKYIISWVRIWSDARSDEGVRHYSRYDGVSNASDSQLHKNHVHISFNETPPPEDDMPLSSADLDKIRAIVKAEVAANNDNAADLVLDRDNKIVNKDDQGVIFDAGAGDYAALKTAILSLGKSVRALRKKLQA